MESEIVGVELEVGIVEPDVGLEAAVVCVGLVTMSGLGLQNSNVH